MVFSPNAQSKKKRTKRTVTSGFCSNLKKVTDSWCSAHKCPNLRKRFAVSVSLTTKLLPQNSISVSKTVSYLVRPPKDGEREEGRWEPRVQHILIWKKRRKKSAVIHLQSHIHILHVRVLTGFQHPVNRTGYHCRMSWNIQSTAQVIIVGWAETSSQLHRLSL